MRDGPARGARDKAKARLQGKVIDLINHAVNVVPQSCPLLFNLVVMGDHLVGRSVEFHLRIGIKPPLRKLIHRLHLGRRNWRANLAPCIGEKFKRARGRNRGVNLTKRARRRVTRIFIWLFAGFDLRCVHSFEINMIDIDLAAHLKDVGPAETRKRFWNIGYG